MKKAYLVTFIPTARIIIEEDELKGLSGNDYLDARWDLAAKKARQKMSHHLDTYLNGDNVDFVEEDVECPFGDLETDVVEEC